ncbi:hypothetical protein CKO_04585 [Citrobacter koseri ATCC BAA-895]|uniref:Uncharacterized protein n=1 Tax=Citrobacter koseri (strain ATCC BAA-895 / CDC 4225-83 / SGSC4696) TaxID=290338 RepID=A8AQ73_CITK8|nr:hypothetical protein CKO_04585 [Citrobacter koseri ATCC BAA-895]
MALTLTGPTDSRPDKAQSAAIRQLNDPSSV